MAVNKVKEDVVSEEPHVEANEFECTVKNCGRYFERKSALTHHLMLKHHTPSVDFAKERVFIVDLKEEGARRPRH